MLCLVVVGWVCFSTWHHRIQKNLLNGKRAVPNMFLLQCDAAWLQCQLSCLGFACLNFAHNNTGFAIPASARGLMWLAYPCLVYCSLKLASWAVLKLNRPFPHPTSTTSTCLVVARQLARPRARQCPAVLRLACNSPLAAWHATSRRAGGLSIS
jgi:hypothetical protein